MQKNKNMFQCKHPKKSFKVSFVSSGMEKGKSLSVFALLQYFNNKFVNIF